MSKQNDLLNVGIKKGTFYLSSNHDQGEGWEKQEFSNPQTGEPMVKYHKKVTIKGDIVYLAMKDDKFKGKCLNAIISGEDESYSLQIPIMGTSKVVAATNEYFNSVVGVLEKLQFGDTIQMFVNNKNEDKKGRLYRNIVVLDEDGKLIKSDFSFEDVPNWESKTTTDDFGEKKTVWNASKANKFFIDKFKAVAERWEEERLERKASKNDDQEGSEPAKESKSRKEPKETSKKELPKVDPNEAFGGAKDEDDLPF
jgi:hypothetical protein